MVIKYIGLRRQVCCEVSQIEFHVLSRSLLDPINAGIKTGWRRETKDVT